MRRLAPIIPLLLTLTQPACGTGMRALRQPAADHHMQAAVIAHDCEELGYDTEGSKCTPETLDLLVKQACLIESIANNDDGEGCFDADQ